MAILVSGGTGFIGSHTCVELLNKGEEVIIFDNLSNSKREVVGKIERITGKKAKFYKADMLDKDALEKIFGENDIEAVVHFAGYKAVGESVHVPLKYFENNIVGTIYLCETMKKHNCKKMVFSSSATVYGMKNKSPLSEEMPLSVTNPYGRTKLMIEDMLRDICTADSEWGVMLLRYFNPIGAHKSGLIGEDPNGIPTNLLPNIVNAVTKKNGPLKVFGSDYPTRDGSCVRDYIHVEDLAAGHVCALKELRRRNGIEAVNLGTGNGYSVFEIIDAFEKVNGVKVPYEIVGRRDGDVAECYANPEKAKRIFKWNATRGISEMCADLWNYVLTNRK
ncbi:MAG: UDP-glucose 4-epimerase GalE [Oscillospiraceae bacterium]|nr:UDP-glucose 4-epimerase GalE [Oscillospiraceae bacterium]